MNRDQACLILALLPALCLEVPASAQTATIDQCVARVTAGAPAGTRAPQRFSRKEIDAIAGTFGFVSAQSATLTRIAATYPDLEAAVGLAALEFERRFPGALDHLDRTLAREVQDWAATRHEVLAGIRARASRPIPRSDAEAFIELVHRRARGEADEEHIRPLLIHLPRYLEEPRREFLAGFQRSYRTDGSGKSRGLRLRLQLPASWEVVEALRPNVVHQFVSGAGHGLESMTLLVRDLGLRPGEQVSRQELEAVLADPAIVPLLLGDSGAMRALCTARSTLDGIPALVIYIRGEMDLPLGRLEHFSVAFVTVAEGRLLQLQGMVGAPSGETPALQARFRAHEPLFRLIAASLVVENQW